MMKWLIAVVILAVAVGLVAYFWLPRSPNRNTELHDAALRLKIAIQGNDDAETRRCANDFEFYGEKWEESDGQRRADVRVKIAKINYSMTLWFIYDQARRNKLEDVLRLQLDDLIITVK